MANFVAKTDPDTSLIDDLERDHRTAWVAVTNREGLG
jgi:hypothetical protein